MVARPRQAPVSLLARVVIGPNFAVLAHRRLSGDTVLLTRPRAQIDHFAALGAKRPERIGRRIFGRGAAVRAGNFFHRHKKSEVAVGQLEFNIGFVKLGALDAAGQDKANVQRVFVGADFRHAG